ncbi:MAG: amidase [Rhodospirillales bacterium]
MANAPHSDLAFLDLAEVADKLRRRDLSSLELTQALYERIAALEPRLKSYVRLMQESALAEARAADEAFARGEQRSLLQGVPVAVKDLYDTAGVVTAGGMGALADRVPQADCTAVARLRQAGAVILGKLTTTEGAMSQHHRTIPTPVNPWSREVSLWSGASSSGSGVATAAGLCFASLGSDTGGSIRFPALCNGIAGIKPTWGRASRHGVLPLSQSLDHVGPLSRTALASAAMLQAIAGPDPDDSTALRAPVPDYLSEMKQGLGGLRLGYDPAHCGEGVEPEVQRCVEAAVAQLRDAGAEVREISLPDANAAVSGWMEICTAECALAHEKIYDRHADDYGSILAFMIETGRAFTARDYARAHLARLDLAGAMAAVFEEVDLVIGPLMAGPVPAASEVDALEPSLEAIRAFLAFSGPAPLCGTPALQLPAGFDSRGAPLGFQLTAGHLQESALFRAGQTWQEITDWHKERPPLAV